MSRKCIRPHLLKENSVFIEIKQGITTMWGEIDTDNLLDFL